MSTTIRDDLRSFRRSWVHHTGMQLATLTVLAATFTVVSFVLMLSFNLKRILNSFGDGVQMTVYLNEDVSNDRVRNLKNELEAMPEVAQVTYVSREIATSNFKQQMASYAPDLLGDSSFANPFPASYRVSFKSAVTSEHDVKRLEETAAAAGKLEGVEDVSYGESWIKNYSSVISALDASGGVIALILIAGGLFVVGNSIRTSVSVRREEIEIMELVGATSGMIRRPFVIEGLIMGAIASVIATSLCLGLHIWGRSVMSSSLALSRLVPLMTFFSALTILGLLLAGSALGAFGAWITVRKINDGWSARQSLDI